MVSVKKRDSSYVCVVERDDGLFVWERDGACESEYMSVCLYNIGRDGPCVRVMEVCCVCQREYTCVHMSERESVCVCVCKRVWSNKDCSLSQNWEFIACFNTRLGNELMMAKSYLDSNLGTHKLKRNYCADCLFIIVALIWPRWHLSQHLFKSGIVGFVMHIVLSVPRCQSNSIFH